MKKQEETLQVNWSQVIDQGAYSPLTDENGELTPIDIEKTKVLSEFFAQCSLAVRLLMPLTSLNL